MSDPRFEALLTIPCTVQGRTVTGADDYGNPTYIETSTDTTCWLDQLSRSEKTVDEVDAEKWRCYLRAGVPILAKDSVTAIGYSFEVDGPPWEVVDALKGTVHHIEATLRRTQ